MSFSQFTGLFHIRDQVIVAVSHGLLSVCRDLAEVPLHFFRGGIELIRQWAHFTGHGVIRLMTDAHLLLFPASLAQLCRHRGYGGKNFQSDLEKLIKKVFTDHQRIIFNGNGYDDAWIKEATEKRGLLNLRTTPDALATVLEKKNVEMLTSLKIFSEAEIRSRYEICLENYCKTVNIEGLTMVDMARKEILPAVEAYLGDLSGTVAAKTAAVPGLACKYEKDLISKLSKLADEISDAASSLDTTLIRLKAIPDVTDAAYVIRDVVLQKMAELRVVCDEAESITADK